MSKVDEFRERYLAAMHAVQTGVKFLSGLEGGGSDLTPQQLRVGINSALVDSGALATLLMNKGIMTKEEYFEAIAVAAEQERERYREEIKERTGADVSLL